MFWDKKDDFGGICLTGITDFSIQFMKPFFKLLQEKIECDDIVIEKIQKKMAKHIHCKIEEYENQNGWGYQRTKVWVTTEEKQEYFEIEDSDSGLEKPCYMWELMLYNIFSEEEIKKEEQKGENDISSMKVEFVFDSPSNSFILFLTGDKFEKKTDSMVDLRFLDDKLLDNAILFRLNPHNFKSLEEYHEDKKFSFPDDPDFYVPMDYFRQYGNLHLDKERGVEERKKGIIWQLRLYDFTKSRLPKIKNEK